MNQKIKTICLVLIILAVLIGVGLYRHTKINYCKKECVYIAYESSIRGGVGSLSISKPIEIERFEADYWRLKLGDTYRNFPTQKQCIDYCLNFK